MSNYEGRRLFILGAGFSAGAGIPMMNKLLGHAMERFKRNDIAIFSRVDAYAAECFEAEVGSVDYTKVDFAELCTYLEYIELREYGGGERWSERGSREKLALRFHLAGAIAESTPGLSGVPALYRSFAAQLREHDIVISFNWDCLLELAIQAAGKSYTYDLAKPGIKLAKLHGSVNWRLGEPQCLGKPVNSLSWEPIGYANGLMPIDMYQTSALLCSSEWDNWKPLREVEPFLVLPGFGKAFDVRSNAVLWYRPEFAFAVTHDIYIIGLSVSDDDFFVKSLFLNTLGDLDAFGESGRRVTIINPNETISDAFSFIKSSGEVRYLKELFAEHHVSEMGG